jgi:hypothetical protein
MRRPARIELVIDEVVLHGFDAGAGAPFAEALTRALRHELGNPALQRALARGASVEVVDAGALPHLPVAAPLAAGAHVGRAVASGLQTAARPTRRNTP